MPKKKAPSKNYAAEHNSNLLWIDMEMTGLDPDSERIIEVAIIVTDQKLNQLAQSPSWVLSCPESVLDGMDDWNVRTHSRSGLLGEVRQSKLTLDEAQKRALEFVGKWAEKGRSPMCGSSIGQDRRFLARWMPQLEAFFHYRNFDVTSFKLGALFFQPHMLFGESRKSNHRASDDISDSIEEMRHYCRLMFAG